MVDEIDHNALAQAQVEAFHNLLSKSYGVSVDDVRESLQFLAEIKRREERWRKYGEWAAKAAIVAIAGYLAVAFARGAYDYFVHLSGLPFRR
jgi:hypothetical protein